MSTILDRVDRVRAMLGNRRDLDTRIVSWLRDSYIELGMNYPFEDLEDSALIDVVPGTDKYSYPTTSVLNGSDTIGFSTRAIKSVTLVLSNGSTIPLRKRNIKFLDRYSSSVGRPSIYASYHNVIVIRPVPNADPSKMLWRIWLKPKIEYDTLSTEILLPEDWLEILDYMAAFRGHTELVERDKAQEIFTLLHGTEDTRSGRRNPGLIKQRILRRQAESVDEEYPIRPIIRRMISTL
jgi:hypothetical protein